jgi:hypothetical protein
MDKLEAFDWALEAVDRRISQIEAGTSYERYRYEMQKLRATREFLRALMNEEGEIKTARRDRDDEHC